MAACYIHVTALLTPSSRAPRLVSVSAQDSAYPPSQSAQQLPALHPPSATVGRFASPASISGKLTTDATPNRHASTVAHAASAPPADLAPSSDADIDRELRGGAPRPLAQRGQDERNAAAVQFLAMDLLEGDSSAAAAMVPSDDRAAVTATARGSVPRGTLVSAPYAFASLPPTPVFPSADAMSAFLSAFANVLRNVPRRGRQQTLPRSAAEASAPPRSSADATSTVTVSGASLAAAGAAVVERVRIGLIAIMGHPTHGVGGGSAWLERKAAAELCLGELERDLDMLRSSRHDLPSSTVVRLATLHCADAARIIRSL